MMRQERYVLIISIIQLQFFIWLSKNNFFNVVTVYSFIYFTLHHIVLFYLVCVSFSYSPLLCLWGCWCWNPNARPWSWMSHTGGHTWKIGWYDSTWENRSWVCSISYSWWSWPNVGHGFWTSGMLKEDLSILTFYAEQFWGIQVYVYLSHKIFFFRFERLWRSVICLQLVYDKRSCLVRPFQRKFR